MKAAHFPDRICTIIVTKELCGSPPIFYCNVCDYIRAIHKLPIHNTYSYGEDKLDASIMEVYVYCCPKFFRKPIIKGKFLHVNWLDHWWKNIKHTWSYVICMYILAFSLISPKGEERLESRATRSGHAAPKTFLVVMG